MPHLLASSQAAEGEEDVLHLPCSRSHAEDATIVQPEKLQHYRTIPLYFLPLLTAESRTISSSILHSMGTK